ncbi:MAG TPA: hypothetical protein VEA37_14405 [Flavobacterium sp.]|nr:hypothetical protein [Flavobacterium sp.]
MKTLFTIAILALTLSLQAQSDTDSNQARLKELKDNILNRFDIESFTLQQEQFEEFTKKLGDSYSIGAEPLAWAKANIDKTKFKDYDEAVKLFNQITTTLEKQDINNKDYYAFIKETATPDDDKLLNKAWEEIMKENPEKFERLTKLYEARLKGKI